MCLQPVFILGIFLVMVCKPTLQRLPFLRECSALCYGRYLGDQLATGNYDGNWNPGTGLVDRGAFSAIPSLLGINARLYR